MQNPRNISELINGGKTLSQLRLRAGDRARVLDQVRAALPMKLAEAVLTAGLEGERLTLGVSAAAWASRLRFHAAELQEAVGVRLGARIASVRVRVIAPP